MFGLFDFPSITFEIIELVQQTNGQSAYVWMFPARLTDFTQVWDFSVSALKSLEGESFDISAKHKGIIDDRWRS